MLCGFLDLYLLFLIYGFVHKVWGFLGFYVLLVIYSLMGLYRFGEFHFFLNLHNAWFEFMPSICLCMIESIVALSLRKTLPPCLVAQKTEETIKDMFGSQ